MKHQRALVIIICSLLFIGFAATTLLSYHFATQTINQKISTENLPLTGDNIYSHVQRDLLSPVLVSSLMAQDTFVHDWAESGEQNPQKMIRYLSGIQNKYHSVTAFFVSEYTRLYYHSTGVLKSVHEADPQDDWYFEVISDPALYDINMDIDTANPKRTTFFVNHKVFGSQGQLLGVIGVGLSSDIIQTLIDDYQKTFGRTVYFVDQSGNVKLHGVSFNKEDSLYKMAGLESLIKPILSQPSGSFEYSSDQQDFYLHSRLIDELGWYILVEEEAQPEKTILQALWIDLLISIFITLLIGWIINHNLNRYQLQLNQLATRDHLTGLSSRQGFEPTFHQMLETARRNQQPLSILLLDLDHFKKINDNHGHLQGDKVLEQVALALGDNIRHCDAISRWGGEEFLLALAECDSHAATQVAEKIRLLISERVKLEKAPELTVTASIGVAEFDLQESAEQLFSRADKALYRAKNNGRNQVAHAPGHATS